MIFSPASGRTWPARLLRFTCALGLLGFFPGCGDNFRPVAAPIPPSGPDPGLLHNAIVLSNTSCPAPCGGNTMHLDTSGDTVSAQIPVGLDPVYETLVSTQTRVLVVNKGEDSLSSYSTFGGPGTVVSKILLPAGSCPTFAQSRDPNFAWVVEPGCGGGVGNVGAVSLLTLQQTAAVPVGTNPVALTELNSGAKVYAANSGSNDVTVINTSDHTVSTTISVGANPMAIDSSDEVQNSSDAHACVYVADQAAGTVSVINPFTDTVSATVAVGTGPSVVHFDPTLRRAYVVNAGANSVSVLTHTPNCVPTVLRTVATGPVPSDVKALADGSRFYVANSGDNTVSVFDAGSFALLATIPVGMKPVSIDASPNSTRIYTANQGTGGGNTGSVSIIRTSDETVVSTMVIPHHTCSGPCQQSPVKVLVTQ